MAALRTLVVGTLRDGAGLPLPATTATGHPVPADPSDDGPAAVPDPQVIADRRDGLVVRFGGLVVKVHDPSTDPLLLAARLRLAALPGARDVLVPPVPVAAAALAEFTARTGRVASVWPAGVPLSAEELDEAPWEQGAVLLARLHAVPLPRGAVGGSAGHGPPHPPVGAPARVRRSIERLRGSAPGRPETALVTEAYETLPRWAVGEAPAPDGGRPALTHGDWHLGQLLRLGGRWRLIDVDDLGVGDPVWDLARPAAWFAVGVLGPDVWRRFLHSYVSAGGTALPSGADPWARLDVPARAMTVQTAAVAVAHATELDEPLDDVALAFLDGCRRITRDNGRSGSGER